MLAINTQQATLQVRFDADIELLKDKNTLEELEQLEREISRYLLDAQQNDPIRIGTGGVRGKLEQERVESIQAHRVELEQVMFEVGYPLAETFISGVRKEIDKAPAAIDRRYTRILKSLDKAVDEIAELTAFGLDLEKECNKFSTLYVKYGIQNAGVPYQFKFPGMRNEVFKEQLAEDGQSWKPMARLILRRFLNTKIIGEKTKSLVVKYAPINLAELAE